MVTHFFFLPRYILLLVILFYATTSTMIISIGADLENLGEMRKKLILWNTCLCMRVFGVIFGVA